MRRARVRPDGPKIHGVNLGNWLVLERWMGSDDHPSPFAKAAAADEHDLRHELARDELEARLDAHRDAYVTEDTFAWLAECGCNLVRLPVPFHVFGDQRHEGCIDYVDRAMDWGTSWGMPVLLDLHTVPGGQNGFDNGGISGLCTWHLKSSQVGRTLEVLEALASRYAGHPALWGIEPMNEPASPLIYAQNRERYGSEHPERMEASTPIPHAVLAQFYRLVVERLRPIVGPDVALVLHDQFQLEAWNRFMPAERYPNVWIDTHQYIGTFARGVHVSSLRGHLLAARATGLRISLAQRHHPVLVGEWSLTNNLRKLDQLTPDERGRAYRSFADAQMAAFDRGGGSCYWSLRNASFASWSLETALSRGWLSLR